jgi:hypothetical protein
MVYEVPPSKRSIKQNQFQFKLAGAEYSLPRFKFIEIGQLELLTQPETRITGLLSIAGGADTPLGAAFRKLVADQLEGLIEAWQEDSGVTLGESSASDNS